MVCVVLLSLLSPMLDSREVPKGPDHNGHRIEHTLSDFTTRYNAVRNILDGLSVPDTMQATNLRTEVHVVPPLKQNPFQGVQQKAAEMQAEFQRRTAEFQAELERRSADFNTEVGRRFEALLAALGQRPQLVDTETTATEVPPAPGAQPALTAMESWRCNSMWYESPRYTGIIWLPIRRNEAGDIECMSLNAKDCGWQKEEPQCRTIIRKYWTASLKPLVCGKMHQRVWRETGYDVPGHWCQTGQAMFPKGA
eukprot:EG_transcript_10210